MEQSASGKMGSGKTLIISRLILMHGLRLSSHKDNMLGAGVYASHTLAKAERYGVVVLRLLAYPGFICTIKRQVHVAYA